MNKRYGCFEILTKCSSCGQPAPLNGPFEKITCSGCFKPVRIPLDTLAGFFNDFDEEHQGYDKGEGSGGTMFGGGGSLEYSYWNLEPRCAKCKAKLPEFSLKTDKTHACSKCNTPFYVYPASERFKNIAPSVKQFISSEKEEKSSADNDLKPDEKESSPIVMSCPKCGGTLSVTEMSERIMKCEYCAVDVYIPDAVWQRMHPVKGTAEWFVRFEGKTLKQQAVSRRKQDLKEEKVDIAKHKALKPLKKRKNIVKYLIIGIPSIAIFFLLLTILLYYMNFSQEETEGIVTTVFTVLFIIFFVFITAAGALHPFVGFWFGKQAKCKKAMSVLADRYGWKHDGSEYKISMGYIRDKYKGTEIEIHPSDDYAVEVDIDYSPFFLKTEKPAWPSEELFRFTSGDERFDNFFPIRYAKPAVVKKMESSEEFKTKILSPLNWFLDRWESQLAVVKIDRSDISVHLFPGWGKTDFSAGRYLNPVQIEPLLSDLVKVSKAIDDIAAGKDPDLSYF